MTLSDNSSSFTTDPQPGPVDAATEAARLEALGALALQAGNGFSPADNPPPVAEAATPLPWPQLTPEQLRTPPSIEAVQRLLNGGLPAATAKPFPFAYLEKLDATTLDTLCDLARRGLLQIKAEAGSDPEWILQTVIPRLLLHPNQRLAALVLSAYKPVCPPRAATSVPSDQAVNPYGFRDGLTIDEYRTQADPKLPLMDVAAVALGHDAYGFSFDACLIGEYPSPQPSGDTTSAAFPDLPDSPADCPASASFEATAPALAHQWPLCAPALPSDAAMPAPSHSSALPTDSGVDPLCPS